MNHVGVCSALCWCCLAAPVWAVDFGERKLADDPIAVALPERQVTVIDDQAFVPWELYGYASPYDQSAIAGYNPWPQVCIDGLWDNYCNERHCHLCKGKQHGGSCGHCGAGRRIHQGQHFGHGRGSISNCATGDCATASETSVLENTPQPVPDTPAAEESSTRLPPRTNAARPPLIPAFWRSVK